MARRRKYRLARSGGAGIAKVRKAEKALIRLKASSVKARAKVGEFVQNILDAGLVGGTAFGMGYWTGKTGKMPALGPVPVDVSVAVGAHLLALLGVGGKMESSIRAIGNGALASFGMRQGQAMAKPGVTGMYNIEGAPALNPYVDGEDYDEDVLEGMALDPGDFAGLEIL